MLKMSSPNESRNRRTRSPERDEWEQRDVRRSTMSPGNNAWSPGSSRRNLRNSRSYQREHSKSPNDSHCSNYHSRYSRSPRSPRRNQSSPEYRRRYSRSTSKGGGRSPESYRSPRREERDDRRSYRSPRRDERYSKRWQRKTRNSRSPRRNQSSPEYRSRYSRSTSRGGGRSPKRYKIHWSPRREERDDRRCNQSPRRDERSSKRRQRRTRNSRSARSNPRSSRRRSRSSMVYKWAHSNRRRSHPATGNYFKPNPSAAFVGYRSEALCPGAEAAGWPAPVRELWVPEDTLPHGPRWMGPPVLAAGPHFIPRMPRFPGPIMPPPMFRPPGFPPRPPIQKYGWGPYGADPYHWRK